MGKKISHMAHQLDSLNKDLQARVQSFGSTINVVESSVKEKGKPVLATRDIIWHHMSEAKSGPAYTSRSNSASARPAPTQVDTTSNAAMMLGDHLNQY